VNSKELYIFRNSSWKPEPLEGADLEKHAVILNSKKRNKSNTIMEYEVEQFLEVEQVRDS
jgi:hypothetical protein